MKLTDDLLVSAAAAARNQMLLNLPAAEEYQHEFSDTFEKEMQILIKQQRHGTIHKCVFLKYGAIAACFCVVLFTMFFGIPNFTNSFVIKACALEVASDNTIIISEADILDQPEVWGGYFDGENFYANVGFRYDGNNIKKVVFSTDTGFFAKQYVGKFTDGKNVTKAYVGEENRIVLYGTNFEVVGNTIALDESSMTDDLLLFWGIPATNQSEVPESVEIKAIATFNNGRTQEIDLPINFSGPGVVTAMVDETTIEERQLRFDYYMNLPLDQCELIEDSIKTVTDVYEVDLGTSSARFTINDDMKFDKDGIWRGGTLGKPISQGVFDIYISVIKQNEDGSYTGLLYRVPRYLQYESK